MEKTGAWYFLCVLIVIRNLPGIITPQYIDIPKIMPEQWANISQEDLDLLEDRCLGDIVD